jgi:hypothetical protein
LVPKRERTSRGIGDDLPELANPRQPQTVVVSQIGREEIKNLDRIRGGFASLDLSSLSASHELSLIFSASFPGWFGGGCRRGFGPRFE